jgi:glycine betaine/proline transport system substrate-binding protein
MGRFRVLAPDVTDEPKVREQMRMRRMKAVAALAMSAMVLTMATACGDEESSGGDSGATGTTSKELTIPVAAGWDEDVAVSNLFKVLLEKKGYDVTLQDMDIGVAFSGVQKGDLDLFFDTWLPTTHEDYWSNIKDDVEDLGAWYDQATLNIAVPEYMKDINSIADLKGQADTFDGSIVGIDPGAGLTRITKDEAMPTYGLDDYSLKTSSTSAMLAALKKATDAKEPIVVTLWHPHWAYSAFPIKDLEDPEGAMGGAEEIHAIARDGFSEDFPELAEALGGFTMDDATLADLEKVVLQEHEDDPEAGAEAWLEANPEFVDSLGL